MLSCPWFPKAREPDGWGTLKRNRSKVFKFLLLSFSIWALVKRMLEPFWKHFNTSCLSPKDTREYIQVYLQLLHFLLRFFKLEQPFETGYRKWKQIVAVTPPVWLYITSLRTSFACCLVSVVTSVWAWLLLGHYRAFQKLWWLSWSPHKSSNRIGCLFKQRIC